MRSCRVKLLSILLVGTLVVAPGSAIVPPPKPVAAQAPVCVGLLAVGHPALAAICAGGMFAWQYGEPAARVLTPIAQRVLAVGVAAGVAVAPAVGLWQGETKQNAVVMQARLDAIAASQESEYGPEKAALERLMASDAEGKDFQLASADGELTSDAAVIGGMVDSAARAGSNGGTFTQSVRWFTGATGWRAADTDQLEYPYLGMASYIGPKSGAVSGSLATLNVKYPMFEWASVGSKASLVRDDGVRILGVNSIEPYMGESHVGNLDASHGYYVIIDSPVYRWTVLHYVLWGPDVPGSEALQMLAGDYEFSAYQPAVKEAVALVPGVPAVWGTTPQQVATGSASYVTNNTTNIYNPAGEGGAVASNWTPEYVGRQVTAAEETSSNTTGLLESIQGVLVAVQGIPAAIAAIPEGIQAKLELWSTPTRDVGTELQGLRDLAATKAPVSWGVELQRTIGLWFGGAAACTVVQLPLGFGKENLALELCPSWVGDWTRPLTALLVYLLLAAYAWRTARRVLWGGG